MADLLPAASAPALTPLPAAKAFIPWPEEPDAAPPAPAPPSSAPPRLLLYLLAALMVFTGSTGPTWFKLMGPQPHPFVKTFWRMFNSFLLQLPLAALEIYRGRWSRGRLRAYLASQTLRALPVGALMSLHFCCVSGAVARTSFAHAMVCINTAPLFFTLAFAARHALSRLLAAPAAHALLAEAPPGAPPAPAQQPPLALPFFHPARSQLPSSLEVAGCALAFGGVCALVSLDAAAASSAADVPASALGDALGLGASLFMALYLCGGALRLPDTPLFCWTCLIHLSAAAVAAALALAAGASTGFEANGLLGAWAGGGPSAGTAGAVLVPSLVAHSLINFLTPEARLGPFLVSMVMNAQPLTGGVFGWAVGVQGQPSALSLLCAPLVICGMVFTSLGKQGTTWGGLWAWARRAVGGA